MSQAFKIVCHDCKVYLWIGQGYLSRLDQATLYNTPEHHQAQRDFLYAHIGHKLEFNESDTLAHFDYQDLTAYDDEDA